MKKLTKILFSFFATLVLIGLTSSDVYAIDSYQLKPNGKVTLTNVNYLYGENICEIHVPKDGYLSFTVNKGASLSYYFCDKNRNDMFSGPQILDEIHGYHALYRVKSGYYYLKNITATGDKVVLSSKFSSGFSLAAGKSLTLNTKSHVQDIFVKIKPAKTGIIKIKTTSSEQGNIALCDSKKKVISQEAAIQNLDSLDTTEFVYAVKKNQTYYIRLKSQEPVTLSWKNSSMTDSSKTKKSAGTILKSGKTYRGLILPKDTKKHWFRISLKKSSPIRLTVNGFSHGQIYMTVTDKDQYELLSYTISSATKKNTVLQTENSYPKGTYYVCVQGADTKSNGWYSLKW